MGAFQSTHFSYSGLLMPSLTKHILSTFCESAAWSQELSCQTLSQSRFLKVMLEEIPKEWGLMKNTDLFLAVGMAAP